MDLYSASPRLNTPLKHYRFPYVGAHLCKLVLQPDTSGQWSLQDHGYGLVYYAMCLFLPQLSPGTHSSLLTEGGLRLSITECLVLLECSLPV